MNRQEFSSTNSVGQATALLSQALFFFMLHYITDSTVQTLLSVLSELNCSVSIPTI